MWTCVAGAWQARERVWTCVAGARASVDIFGRCGEWGHTKASRLCPFFDVKEQQPDEVFRDGTVKQNHSGGALKLTLDMTKVQEKASQAEAEHKAAAERANRQIRKKLEASDQRRPSPPHLSPHLT